MSPAPATNERPQLETPVFTPSRLPSPQPLTNAPPTTQLSSLQTGAGNAAIASAANTGPITPSPGFYPPQSTVGNAAATQAAQTHKPASGENAVLSLPATHLAVTGVTQNSLMSAAQVNAPMAAEPTAIEAQSVAAMAARTAPLANTSSETETATIAGRVPPPATLVSAETQTPPITAPTPSPTPLVTPFHGSGTSGEKAPLTKTGQSGQPQNESQAASPGESAPATVNAEEVAATTSVAETSAAASAAMEQISTGEPDAVLDALRSMPPSHLATGIGAARTASAASFDSMHDELAASPPSLERPSGLPRKALSTQEGAEGGPQTVVPPEVKPVSGEQPQIELTHLPSATQLPADNIQEFVLDRVPENSEALASSASQVLATMPTDDGTVNTSGGERPVVALNDDADPAQMTRQQEENTSASNSEWSNARESMLEDEGENNIYPSVPEETLSASFEPHKLSATTRSLAAPATPEEALAGFDQAAAAKWSMDINTAQKDHAVAKEQKETDERAKRDETKTEIARLEAETTEQQSGAQLKAKQCVSDAKVGWQADLVAADATYTTKAQSLHTEYRGKIDTTKQKADADANAKLVEAERNAAAKKQQAQKDADAEKRKAEKESGGFFGWLKSKAKALIKALKDVLNAIFDALRAAVKFIIETAKKAAVWLIEQARKAIVGFIRAFGELLSLAADVFLAAFPKARDKAKALIRRGVEEAEDAVNAAADALKAGVSALLDALGAALDFILELYQKAYNLVLDALEFIVVGLIEIMERIGHLVSAAREMPDHFWGQAQEEVLGMNLSEPLPFERKTPPRPETAARAAVTSGAITSGDSDVLTKEHLNDSEVTVNSIGEFSLEPELLAQLSLEEGGEVEFGENPDPSRSVAAIQAEAAVGTAARGPNYSEESTPTEIEGMGASTESPAPAVDDTEARLQAMIDQEPEGACSKEKKGEPGAESAIPEEMKLNPLTQSQRARYLFSQMKKGVTHWFSCNWPWLLAAVIGALVGIIVANILTGGAIMAALPIVMELVTIVMAGVALARVTSYVGEYLGKGWVGEITGAAKSLARGIAVGAIELIFALIFNIGAVIKAAKSALTTGLKSSAKAAAKAAKASVTATLKSVKTLGTIAKTGARTAVKNSKLVLKGLRGNIAKGARSLDDLAKRLWDKLRFRKFKIRLKGGFIELLGFINPWVLVAKSRIEKVPKSAIPKGTFLGDIVTVKAGGKSITGELVGWGPKPMHRVIGKLTHGAKVADESWFHHLFEQQILKMRRYVTFTLEELNAPAHLIPMTKGAFNEVVHLSRIRTMWDKFYTVLRARKPIDKVANRTIVEKFADYSKQFIDEMKNFTRTNSAVKAAQNAGNSKRIKELLADHAKNITKPGGTFDLTKALDDAFK